MKYQGFYDYSLDASGNPDRTFTAKQFCMYLKGLLGNGIGITNATGENAWKVEKTGDLIAKITLGNNGYNFASLNGNPFIIDEELEFTFSQGTDRWDAVLIRADSSMEVRATDVVIQENDISYTRNTDIYDLRIARVHIVDNVITEIIDDRLNNEYCGIADGLVTVPTSELEKLLEDVKSGNLVALKDGTLQENLNVEMISGLKLGEVNSLISKYNVPVIPKRNDSYNYLTLSNKITEYTTGMRVLIIIQQEYEDFNEPIIPALSGYGQANAINGMYAYSNDASNNHQAFDGNDNTYSEGVNPSKINFPQGIKPTKIKLVYSRSSEATGNKVNSLDINGFFTVTPNTSVQTIEQTVTSNNYITSLSSWSSFSYNRVHTLQITAGSIGKFCPGINSYININNLGDKLVEGSMTPGKKYELVYDGTIFNAREVA